MSIIHLISLTWSEFGSVFLMYMITKEFGGHHKGSINLYSCKNIPSLPCTPHFSFIIHFKPNGYASLNWFIHKHMLLSWILGNSRDWIPIVLHKSIRISLAHPPFPSPASYVFVSHSPSLSLNPSFFPSPPLHLSLSLSPYPTHSVFL